MSVSWETADSIAKLQLPGNTIIYEVKDGLSRTAIDTLLGDHTLEALKGGAWSAVASSLSGSSDLTTDTIVKTYVDTEVKKANYIVNVTGAGPTSFTIDKSYSDIVTAVNAGYNVFLQGNLGMQARFQFASKVGTTLTFVMNVDDEWYKLHVKESNPNTATLYSGSMALIQGTGISITSGTSGSTISVTNPVPQAQSTDYGKYLKSNETSGAPEWDDLISANDGKFKLNGTTVWSANSNDDLNIKITTGSVNGALSFGFENGSSSVSMPITIHGLENYTTIAIASTIGDTGLVDATVVKGYVDGFASKLGSAATLNYATSVSGANNKLVTDSGIKSYVDTTVGAETTRATGVESGLESRIENLEARGRFLSSWNVGTGVPGDYPAIPSTATTSYTYEYKSGDYYIVNSVPASGTKYKPSGSSITATKSGDTWTWTVGKATTTDEIAVGDQFMYTNNNWILIHTEQKEVVWGGIGGTLSNQTDLQNALDAITASIKDGQFQINGTKKWSANSSDNYNLVVGTTTTARSFNFDGSAVSVSLGNGNIEANGTTVWNAVDSASVFNITSGSANGAISFGGTDVKVKGLADAAFVDTTIFAGANKQTGEATVTPAGSISVGTGTANYTPSGSVTGGSLTLTPTKATFDNVTAAELNSTPTFTGASLNITHSITSMGSVSTSTVVTPQGHLTDAALSTATATTITAHTAGSAASYTAGAFSQGSLPTWSATVNNNVLVFSWDAGTLPTHDADTFTPNTPTSITTANMSVATGIQTQATFAGDNTTVAISANVTGMAIGNHTITPSGTISKPSIDLTKASVTYVSNVSGDVSSLGFSGSPVELKFTGSASTHTHNQTPSD